jgi:hypothetical protein
MHRWHIHQIDVNNVFLHSDIQKDVYMTIPPGVTSTKPNQVCKLIKSLYEKLTYILIQHNYQQSTSDRSLLIKHSPTNFTLLH